MRYQHVCLHAFGCVLPPEELTSAAIEEQLAPLYQRLKLPAGRLELMTGIRARRLWPEGMRPSEGAAAAGRQAIERSGCKAGNKGGEAAASLIEMVELLAQLKIPS